MNKQLQINAPKGYEIDLDKSDLSKSVIYFKECKKVLSYEDVAKELFNNVKNQPYISGQSDIIIKTSSWDKYCHNPTIGNQAQLESILALNKLCNVAKYLNGDWLPDWENEDDEKASISYMDEEIEIIESYLLQTSEVYFKSKKLAQQAIEILGKEEIRKALTLNH
jgi:hypothetical protein